MVATLISEWLLTSAVLLVIITDMKADTCQTQLPQAVAGRKKTVNEDTEVTAIHCC